MQIKNLAANSLPMNGPQLNAPAKLRADAAAAPGAASSEKEAGRIQAACTEMESIFIYHLLKEMQATIPKSGLMGDGKAESIYTDMLHQQLSRDLAVGGGIGLSDILMAQLAEGFGRESDEKPGEEKKGILASGSKVL